MAGQMDGVEIIESEVAEDFEMHLRGEPPESFGRETFGYGGGLAGHIWCKWWLKCLVDEETHDSDSGDGIIHKVRLMSLVL